MTPLNIVFELFFSLSFCVRVFFTRQLFRIWTATTFTLLPFLATFFDTCCFYYNTTVCCFYYCCLIILHCHFFCCSSAILFINCQQTPEQSSLCSQDTLPQLTHIFALRTTSHGATYERQFWCSLLVAGQRLNTFLPHW